MGDVDNDGGVAISDILLIRNAIFGDELTGDDFIAADLDFSGTMSIGDILICRNIIFGDDPPDWPTLAAPESSWNTEQTSGSVDVTVCWVF